MKSDAKYTFKKTPYSIPRLIPYEHIGIDIPEFPPKWIEPNWEYSHSRMPIKEPPKYKNVYLRNPSHPIFLKFIPEIPNFMFGFFKNDAILVKFERTRYEIFKITIWFFQDMKQQVEMLYEQWISCQLELD